MPVQINITGSDAAEATKELMDLAAGFNGGAESEKPKRNAASKKDEAKDKAITKPDVKEDADSDDAENIPTAVEIRAKAQEVGSDAKKKPKIKALLTEFDVENISSIPEEQRADFMKRLEAL